MSFGTRRRVRRLAARIDREPWSWSLFWGTFIFLSAISLASAAFAWWMTAEK